MPQFQTDPYRLLDGYDGYDGFYMVDIHQLCWMVRHTTT